MFPKTVVIFLCTIPLGYQACQEGRKIQELEGPRLPGSSADTLSKVNALLAKGDLKHDTPKQVELFKTFVVTEKRHYSSVDELKRRFELFRNNVRKIGEKYFKPNGISDRSPEEILFKTGHLPVPAEQEQAILDDREEVEKLLNRSYKGPLPDDLDWRDKNIVSPVMAQNGCGACWAFALAGMLEGQYALATKTLVPLSKSQLVECDHQDYGCHGGYVWQAVKYTHRMGLESEADYPYRNDHGKTYHCQYNSSKIKVYSDKYYKFRGANTILQMLVQHGPVVALMNSHLLHSYTAGMIFADPSNCDPARWAMNHVVLIVGYGREGVHGDSTPFWIVKNSWGENWGVYGYFRIERGANACGIENFGIFTTVRLRTNGSAAVNASLGP
ncbi:hypothetical protein M8J76_010703 [Diaphorina citri]|nr:hypothetical protein M8J75_011159 [Diaphorina citri]KAI5716693.1 hypothetical protein M8J76_010703 [Diaphorina citri]